MPWRGPEHDGEFPSLGWGLLDWFESNFKIADGPMAGQPLVMTDEQATIIVRFYAIDDRGRWVYRRASVRRAQGWGKSPLLGAVSLGELCGPTRFDGWDAAGEPVGVAPVAPWVQIAALSEDQTDNTYASVHGMAAESDLANTVMDVGITRIYLKDNKPGRLEPVTSAAGSRLGQRITFCVIDEPHLMTKRNGGVKLAATVRRNAGKMNGRTFESTNAHRPGENSVAEGTFKAHLVGAAGLLYDSVEAPKVEDMRDLVEVRAALTVAYGDSAMFVDLDRIANEIIDPGTDEDDARRFYLNQLVSGTGRIDMSLWPDLVDADSVEAGSVIGLGFDGSISGDSTILWGCTEDAKLFELGVWERPEDAPRDWRVPRVEVRAAVRDAFARFRVGRMLCDPPKWYTEIEDWAQEFGDEVVLAFETNSARRFAPACGRFMTMLAEGELTHDGSTVLTAHLANSEKKAVRLADDPADGRSQFVIVKGPERGKIDAAVAGVLALEAAMSMPADAGEIEAVPAFVFT